MAEEAGTGSLLVFKLPAASLNTSEMPSDISAHKQAMCCLCVQVHRAGTHTGTNSDVHCRCDWKLTVTKHKLLDSQDKETYSCVDLQAQFLKLRVCVHVWGGPVYIHV